MPASVREVSAVNFSLKNFTTKNFRKTNNFDLWTKTICDEKFCQYGSIRHLHNVVDFFTCTTYFIEIHYRNPLDHGCGLLSLQNCMYEITMLVYLFAIL